jgi:hypothetical protein
MEAQVALTAFSTLLTLMSVPELLSTKQVMLVKCSVVLAQYIFSVDVLNYLRLSLSEFQAFEFTRSSIDLFNPLQLRRRQIAAIPQHFVDHVFNTLHALPFPLIVRHNSRTLNDQTTGAR